MGLLEDAIREHLDLKRKHGASHDELLQEEADALGPARREDLAAEHADPVAGGDDAAAAEADEDEALAHEPAPEAPEADVEQPQTAPPGEHPKAESQEDELTETPLPAEKSLLEDTPDFEPDAREPGTPAAEPG